MSVTIVGKTPSVTLTSNNNTVSISSKNNSVNISSKNNLVNLSPSKSMATFSMKGVAGVGLLPRQGFIDYNDTSTSSSPLALQDGIWVDIPNNGLGAFTNKSYAPQGVSELMDTANGKIDVTQLALGDSIVIRNDFTVTPQTNNSSLRFRYTLGSGSGSYTLEKRLGRLDEGSGIGYRFSLTTDLIYMGDENTRDNPIGLQVNLSTSGTLVNAGSVISVVRYNV